MQQLQMSLFLSSNYHTSYLVPPNASVRESPRCARILEQRCAELLLGTHGAGLPEENRKERLRKKKKGNAPHLRAELFRMTGTDLTQIDTGLTSPRP